MESNADDPSSSLREICVSCGAKLKGDYCRKCGEKKIVPERDFSIIKFLNQTLWHFTHFDSKWLRCCWLLFSKPGFLTAEWTTGRRVAYMKPLQLFVVASILFYFFLPTTTAYFSDFRDLIKGYQEQNRMMNLFQVDLEKTLPEKALALGMDESEVKNKVLSEASQKSKTWLFLLIPFWGGLIYLFYKRKVPWLAPHLIFAMHGLTFYLLFDLTIHAIVAILGFGKIGKYILFVLMLTFSVYQALALRRVYGDTWTSTIFKTAGIAAGFILLIMVYRQVITIWTIAAL